MTSITTNYPDEAVSAYLASQRVRNARVVRECLKAVAGETKDPRLMTALLVVAGAGDETLDRVFRGVKI